MIGQAIASPSASEPLVLVEGLSCRFGTRVVLSGISFAVQTGEFLGILGPNGCGKTTLLRCIAGLHKPDAGRVRIGGADVSTSRPPQLARRLALQAQDAQSALGYTVRDVVGMGRLAHRSGPFAAGTDRDNAIVDECLNTFGVADLAERSIESLSGGERQRVMMARAAAQQPAILLLDEPTNHLDVHHRFAVMSVVRKLGITVMATLHDIEFAARLCDRLIVLSAGRIGADAPAGEALTPDLIREVYGVSAGIDRHPDSGQIRIDLQPLGERCA